MGDQFVEASKCVLSFLDLTIVQQYTILSHNCVAFVSHFKWSRKVDSLNDARVEICRNFLYRTFMNL